MNTGFLIAGAVAIAIALGVATHRVYRIGFAAGAAATQRDAAQKVDAAQALARDAQAARFAAEQERDALQGTFDRQRQTLVDLAAAAQSAVRNRDVLQAEFDRMADRAKAAAKEDAHAQPDCAALVRVPVCVAVAGRLWPGTPSAPVASRH